MALAERGQVRKTIFYIVLFAVAFAFIEAAVVVYLRKLFGFETSYPPLEKGDTLFAIPGIIAFLKKEATLKVILDKELLNVELIREVATLVVLGTLAQLAAKNLRQKISFFFLAFAVWDLFYYLFLKLTINWPKTLFDLDVYFLLPVPWVGPVVLPIVFSLGLILGLLSYASRRCFGQRRKLK